MSLVVFISLADLSKLSGSGIATREIATELGRQASDEFHVICPTPINQFPESLENNVDRFHSLPARTSPGDPLWHAKVEIVLLARFTKIIRNRNPSLVVTRLSQSTMFPAPLCRLHGIPHMLLIRGLINKHNEYGQTEFPQFVEQILRLNVRFADEVYVAFEAIRKAIEKYRKETQSPIKLLPNAVNPELFTPREMRLTRRELGIDYEGFLLGFIGSLSPRHMLPELIRAVARVENVRLMIVGGGGIESELKQLAGKLNLRERVTFVGRVAHEDVPKYINACNATYGVVSPKHPSNPIKCYESLACERPLITSHAPELDFVIEKQAGLVLSTVDVPEIASAIRDLRNTPRDELQNMGRRGRKYVRKHHTWTSVANQILPDDYVEETVQ